MGCIPGAATVIGNWWQDPFMKKSRLAHRRFKQTIEYIHDPSCRARDGTLLVKALYRDETRIRFLTENVHSMFNPFARWPQDVSWPGSYDMGG